MTSFKEKLKELRLEKNLYQKDLAKELGVSQRCIGNWESGYREPDYDTLKKLAIYFNVSTDYLLGLEN